MRTKLEKRQTSENGDALTSLELLSISKAVIHGLSMDVSSSVDWDAEMKLAARHQVLPLVFETQSYCCKTSYIAGDLEMICRNFAQQVQ